MRDDPRISDETMRERASRLKQENARLRSALAAAEETARLERQRAEAATEAARRAWRIAGGYR